VRIAVIVEGETERVFLPFLRSFLESRIPGRMPRLVPRPFDGRIPTSARLKRLVERLINDGIHSADAVIALTDVYTGTIPPQFVDAADAKAKMRAWVGQNPNFHPHAAQYDFDAWLLPYWPKIQQLAGSNRASPGPNPEQVNHDNPPAHRLREAFRSGSRGRAYVKPRDAGRILKDQDLLVAVQNCPELKSLVNTILTLCGGDSIS
jgi:Domain of unknown function (DUF4276)